MGTRRRKTATCQEAKLPKQGKPPFGHFQVQSHLLPFHLSTYLPLRSKKQTSKDLHLSSCWHKLHGADEIVFTLTLAIRISTSLSTTESHPMSMSTVRAVHTFVAEHGDELEFSAGEEIEVLERDEAFGDGWWRVRPELS